MKLSIIIPVYNEERTILKLLDRLEAVQFPIEREIIIVDDGSTDGTTQLLKSEILNSKSETNSKLQTPNSKIKVVFLEKNCGKGMALRCGFQEASGEIIAIQDADLEYNPQELPKLIEPILEDRAKVIYGSRFLFKHKPRYKIPYLGNRFLSFLFWFLYGKKINDPWTCYKIFRREIIQSMNFQSKGFEFEMEFTAKILKVGYQILELPISYQSRTYAEGKKIKIRDGLKAIWTIIKFRFS